MGINNVKECASNQLEAFCDKKEGKILPLEDLELEALENYRIVKFCIKRQKQYFGHYFIEIDLKKLDHGENDKIFYWHIEKVHYFIRQKLSSDKEKCY